ncbi:MAG TPA: alpha/beta hydrolase-fold protein [Chitinophagaceae bacterium]|nr:alpha/beta hydrolase-fold protein [Chitinophagaceae bacterium]
MKKLLFSLFGLFFTLLVQGQYSLTITLISKAPISDSDSLFVAGSFNGWNPSSSDYILQKQKDGKYVIQIKDRPAGICEFKFTRGTWAKVECSASGGDVNNHFLKINGDTSVSYEVEAWKDAFGTAIVKHTISPHVKIIDTAFVIPQLNRTRRIWIYLPDGYAQSDKRYPVLYLHDGQNVFDAATSFSGEWNVDETMDSLIKKGAKSCIVVAIDNGGSKRLNEYTPYDFNINDTQQIKAEGNEYLDFIAKVLKPFIDKTYRTNKDKSSTYIAGSSLGGLISFYALIKYPDIFGGAGIFSPSFWIIPQLNKTLEEAALRVNAKIFFYAGDKESETMVSLMDSVAEHIGLHTQSIIYKIVDPDGKHNEATWRKWFPEFYQWMVEEKYKRVNNKTKIK